jgi:tetratricopeptide (TPR) repeat protein
MMEPTWNRPPRHTKTTDSAGTFRQSLCRIFALALVVQIFLPAALTWADLRNLKIGEQMPQFSLPDSNGGTFAYTHGRNKVLIVVFLPPAQRRIGRTITDVERVIEELQGNAKELNFVGVISGPAVKDIPAPAKPDAKLTFPILLDGDFHLWGKLGVIAAPTVVIAGKDDIVAWTKAGYGYDFVPMVRVHIEQVLGIVQENAMEDAEQVKTVTNDTVEARTQRHLQMAKILETKGRIEPAIDELQKAVRLDPNDIEPSLQLGELLCKVGRNEEALNLAGKLQATTKSDRGRLLVISGWAKRQMGDVETAERLLREATTLNPTSIRALFELGKTQQARGRTEEAMKSYRAALSLLFGETSSGQSQRVGISEK